MARLPAAHLPLLIALGSCAPLATPAPVVDQATSEPAASIDVRVLGAKLQVGDLVFIRISALPFDNVARATGSWTNHVGIIVDVSGREPLVAESRFPLSSKTTLSRFVARSAAGRVAVTRLNFPLSDEQQRDLQSAARKRSGVLYDTGFSLHSRRQFCSRFVREVLDEATGVKVGEVETFSTLFARHPKADLGFWRVWYFGNIPWQRETVTPESVLHSAQMHTVVDGFVREGTTASRSIKSHLSGSRVSIQIDASIH